MPNYAFLHDRSYMQSGTNIIVFAIGKLACFGTKLNVEGQPLLCLRCQGDWQWWRMAVLLMAVEESVAMLSLLSVRCEGILYYPSKLERLGQPRRISLPLKTEAYKFRMLQRRIPHQTDHATLSPPQGPDRKRCWRKNSFLVIPCPCDTHF